MKPSPFLAIVTLLCAASIHVSATAAEINDDASQSTYGGNWNEPGGGNAFGDWKFQETHGSTESFAGHFLADVRTNPEAAAVASGGKAFGLYANGPEFETATAARAFSNALKAGDVFSFQMTNPVIEQKGAADNPGAGSIGLTLRNGNAADSPDDYNKNARFEIVNLKGEASYQVYDGEATHDTGVTYCEKGITVTIKLTGIDTYDLEITRLADNKTTKLSGRKLGGSGAVESFCVFNRNGEKADGFFNHFQVVGSGK